MNNYYTLICQIGYHVSHIGYMYLADAIEYAVNNFEDAYLSFGNIYKYVAERRHVSTHAVAKAIERVADDIWDNNRVKLFKFLGNEVSEKLTAGDLIIFCATHANEYLTAE